MAIPQIERIGQADDLSSALVVGKERSLALVLLDSNATDGELLTTLDRIKTEWPQARCIVLVDNEEEFQVVQTSGVDAVLFKGFPASKLITTIERLLTQRDDYHCQEQNR